MARSSAGEVNMARSSAEVNGAVATIVENTSFEVLLSEDVDENNAEVSYERFKPIAEEVKSDDDAEAHLNDTGLQQEEVEQGRGYTDPIVWKPYIKSLLAAGVTGLHLASLPSYDGNTCPTVEDYLKPDILIWNLKNENPGLEGQRCFHETCCSKLRLPPMKGAYFTRWLYDFERPLLLVTSVAQCKAPEKHRFLGYDPRLLKQFPDQENVPFMLFHRSGFTRGMFNSIMSRVSNGVKFYVIQEKLRNNYDKSHAERKVAYLTALSCFNDEHPERRSMKRFPELKIKGPRESFISQCFILGFKDKEYFYKLAMAQLAADEWIKLATSYQLTPNNANGFWKKEQGHIILCQNEVGQVLSWKLGSIGSYDEIREMLVSVKEGHERIGKELKGCSTSLCCEWREELQLTFGREFKVKADIEQAVCQFSGALDAKDSSFAACVEDFRSVFLDPAEYTEVRMLATPSSNVIMSNLQRFKGKWVKRIDDKDRPVLSYESTLALYDIQQHILKGCYSEIVPLPNDIDSSKFHSMLKTKVNNSSLGIPATVAITTIAIHKYNVDRQKELGRDTAPVLVVVPNEEGQLNGNGNNSASVGVNLKCLTIDVDINKTLERIASNPAKECANSGSILKSTIAYVDKKKQELLAQMAELCLKECIMKKAMVFLRFNETLEKSVPNGMVATNLIPFLTCAFPLLLQQNREKLTSSDKKAVDDEVDKFKDLQTMWKNEQRRREREMSSEEDKLLYTVAVILESYLSRSISSTEEASELNSYQEFLLSQDFDIGMKASEIVIKLKNAVAEKMNKAEEAKRAASSNIDVADTGIQQDSCSVEVITGTIDKHGTQQQIKSKEVESGASAGDPTSGESSFARITKEQLSTEEDFELFVREIANVLSANIVIISDLAYFPIIPIFSQMISIWSPSFFVYCKRRNFVPIISKQFIPLEQQSENKMSTHGEGWSDSDESDTEKKTKENDPNAKCDCGRSKPSSTTSRCFEDKNSKYKTRCKCVKANRKCTDRCTCRNCHNPLGARIWVRKRFRKDSKDAPAKTPEKKKIKKEYISATRKRFSHQLSIMWNNMIKASGASAIPAEHGACIGEWSLAEKFLLEALITEIKAEEGALTADLVTGKYNNIALVASEINDLKNMVYHKTLQQVNERLKEREKEVETYLSMYQKQLDLMTKR
eukprot:Seg2656.4 transcript_id=Seg2656.4/GoldUCD/mRNA.D3Y31 product="hypothetical protein" protein_id=Seg2656.4/GoldUCD/D3Y31